MTAASEGNYSVVVANSSGSVTSAPAMLFWDSVGDGIPDFWKIQYFGSINNVIASSDAPLHDGISNLQKFHDGINPTNGIGLKPRLVLAGLNGSVSASPDLDKYTLGQPVTLTANSHPGFQFVGWSGDLLGTNNPVTLVMDTNKIISAVCGLPLVYTLDTTNISWCSGGDVPWFGQDFVTYDGVAAVQNGPLGNNQVSWLEATVYMPQDGLLTFWWKRVASPGSDLTLTVNGTPRTGQIPNSDWSQSTWYLPAGTDVIRWTYTKSYDGGQGFDAYWIDQVATTVFADPLADSDLDGLPDLWEYRYFGDLRNAGTQDYEGDGVDNRQEYLDGTDPTDAGSVRPRLTVTAAGGTVGLSPSFPSYSYLQPVTLTATPAPGYTFVGWRGDLIGPTNPATLTMDKSKTVTANFALSTANALAEALDATNLAWSVGGDAPFFAQTLTSHDGVDAAQSPPLASSQQSWFQTTVNGPGTLSFWWKTASSFAYLQFWVNGVQQTLFPALDWRQVTVNLGAGANTLRWLFLANFPPLPGSDAGWVDQVTFGTNVPSIATVPVSQTVLQGSNVSFTVTAASSSPLTYRWQKNGINLSDGGSVSGTVTSTLTLRSVQTSDSGTYSVLVSTPAATVSAAASLNVVALMPLEQALDTPTWTWTSGGDAGWFGQNLVSYDGLDAAQAGAVVGGQQSWLQTTLTGPGALNFWWKVSSVDARNHLDCVVDGVTNASIAGDAGWVPRTFLIPPGQHTARFQYIQTYYSPLVVQSAWLDQVSFVAGLPPVITASPVSQTVTGGVDVTFTVAVSGTTPLNYQWLFNRTNLIGPNSATLTLHIVQLGDAGGYSVVVSNALGKIASVTADLVVQVPPVIITQPSGASAPVGSDLTLSVVTGGAAPLYYQWRKDGLSFAGGTQSSLALTNVQTSDSGNYTVVITNWLGSITSAVAQISIGVPPSITSQPTDQTAALGSTVTFSVTAAGTAPLHYQWQENGFDLPGRTDANLVLVSVQYSDAGTYSVVVSNAFGSVISATATLSVGAAMAPTILAQPQSQTVQPGGAATFTVSASGASPLFYQWLHYGTNLPGATDSLLSLVNVQPADAGPYAVMVTNSYGSVTSQVATLTVGGSGFNLSIAETNGTVNLNWNALVGQVYQVEYESDLSAGFWSNLTSQLTATNPLMAASDSMGGRQQRFYRVELMPPTGSAPTITTQPVSQNVSPGANVTFSVAATGSAPLSYQWQKNGSDLPGQTTSTLQLNNVQSADIGVYDVVVSNPFGSVTSDPAVLLVF